jgi:hypothetical protein
MINMVRSFEYITSRKMYCSDMKNRIKLFTFIPFLESGKGDKRRD